MFVAVFIPDSFSSKSFYYKINSTILPFLLTKSIYTKKSVCYGYLLIRFFQLSLDFLKELYFLCTRKMWFFINKFKHDNRIKSISPKLTKIYLTLAKDQILVIDSKFKSFRIVI